MITREVLGQIERLIRPLRNRIANLCARASVQLVADADGIQRLQVSALADEVLGDIERMGQYGFFSVPLGGAEALVLFVDGDRGHGVAVSVDDPRYRPKAGDPGDAGLYHHKGDEVRLTEDGATRVIVLTTGGEARIGSISASELVALHSDLTALKAKFDSWTPVANDGGAALKTLLGGWSPVGSSKVKVE